MSSPLREGGRPGPVRLRLAAAAAFAVFLFAILAVAALALVGVEAIGEQGAWLRNALLVLVGLLVAGGGVGSWIVYSILRDREAELRRSEARYRAIVRESRDAIYVSERDGTIEEMNPAGLELFGYSDMAGMSALVLYHDPSDRERFRRRIAEEGSVVEFEVELETVDGEVLDCLLTSTERREGGELVGYQGIIRDVTERKRFERQLQHRAMHDPLTELPNRALFWDRLEQALSRLRRRGGGIAVLFVDLDGFKKINDSLGHAAGDRVLVEVADRVRSALREPDTVARLGGDEFGVLVEDLDGAADAEEVAERLTSAFAAPMILATHEAYLSASVGIALAGPTVGQTGAVALEPDDLVRQADSAMYRAKEEPGSHFRVFDPERDTRAAGRLQRENELRRAIEQREFVLHYQPVYAMATGELAAVEPLVRWRHPDGHVRAPGEFLPLATETGLVRALGRWVVRETLRQAAEWNGRLPPERAVRVHPNSSASEFEAPDFVELVDEALVATGLAPELVYLEITEQVALSSVQRVRELRRLGIRIAIDDFGTGYSSLTHIKQLEVDVLKVDRSFVAGLGRDETDEAIVETILTLAHELGLEVVAEGVETPEQRAWLEERGCTHAQGYLLGRPVPADELERELVAAAETEPAEAEG